MPGIYVRATGQLDWMQQRVDSVLTVPGSYWLCHKRNIYKFIFKFHRSDRKTKVFTQEKELMKIVRRIIKSHPRQGQQFGTHHLLVTCKHVAWTRQEKMFAMLRFKDRTDASAFSHAFELIVKLVSPQKVSGVDICDSLVLADRNKEKVDPCVHSPENVLPKKDQREYGPVERIRRRPVCKNTDVEMTSTNTNLMKAINNTDTVNTVKAQSSLRKGAGSSSQTTDMPVRSHQSRSRNAEQKHDVDSKLVKQISDKVNKQRHAIDTESSSLSCSRMETDSEKLITSEYSSERDVEMLDDAEEFSFLNKFYPERTSPHCKKNNVRNITDSVHDDVSGTDEINTDAVNLPYQYLIEEEIENAKNKLLESAPLSNVDSPGKSNCNARNDMRKQKSIRDIEKKYVTGNNKPSRSSDITDLVMEGLMFTIKQGEDSVAVIEQKTKLEVDEVLENSEKVETKEGEKCLKNSSLLGLENLITMIESPDLASRKNKNYNIANVENNLHFANDNWSSEPTLGDHYTEGNTLQPSESSHAFNLQPFNDDTPLASTSFAHSFDQFADNEIKPSTSETDEAEKHENGGEEEEEDIVPEALQNNMHPASEFSSEKMSVDKILEMNRDLLMDDVEDTDERKADAFRLKSSLNTPPVALSSRTQSPLNNTTESAGCTVAGKLANCTLNSNSKSELPQKAKHQLNVPRVVSNQIITVDQIPLALQRALKNKLLKQNVPFTNKDESCKKESEPNNADASFTKDTSNAQSNTECNMQCSSGETVIDPPFPTLYELHKTNENVVNNEIASSVVLARETRRSSCSSNNSKTVKKEFPVQGRTLYKRKRLPPKRLQDITQDFYRDLSQIEKKSGTANQRCLRQRRKSANSAGVSDDNMSVEMLKFIHDITRGAKVVVKRMSTKSISDILQKRSSIATYLH